MQIGRGRRSRLEQRGVAVGERVAVGVPAGAFRHRHRRPRLVAVARVERLASDEQSGARPAVRQWAVSDIAPSEAPVAFTRRGGTPDATTGEYDRDAALGLVDHDRDAVGVGRVPLLLMHEQRPVGSAEQRVGAALDRRAHRLGVEHAVQLFERVRRPQRHRVDTGALGHPLEQLHQVGHDPGADLVVGHEQFLDPGADRRPGRPPTTS